MAGPADRVEEGIAFVQENVLPKAQQLDGWQGYTYLVDRPTGRAALITFWSSMDALRASEEQANTLREESAQAFGETITGVERYEAFFVGAAAGSRA